MSLKLNGERHLPQNPTKLEVCHQCSLLDSPGNAGASWRCFPAAKFLEKKTPDSLLLDILTA